MLILLVTGVRGQAAHLLNVRNMDLSYSQAVFTIGDKLKNSRPAVHAGTIKLTAFVGDRRLCVITYVKHYLRRTLDIRGVVKQLFLCIKATHGGGKS